MTTIPALETERPILRGRRASDAPSLAEICADADLMRYVGGVMGQANAWRRMATYAGHWVRRGYGSFALEDKASGKLAGDSGIYDPDGWPEREINWGLARPFLGKGLVTDAARRVRQYADDTLGFETITSCIATDTNPSIAVATRLGATLDRTVERGSAGIAIDRHISPAACKRERGQ